MKKISILTPCFNEVENVEELHRVIREIMQKLPAYDYEHVYIDNASTDGTQEILRRLASEDSRVKVIFNTRNFGHIRSPMHGLFETSGDATLLMVSDFQDPPELIPKFIEEWEKGFKAVVGIKQNSEETPIFFAIRRGYYRLIRRLAEVNILENFTGFGLYDQSLIQFCRELKDPYPFFRGLISESGMAVSKIPYTQPKRRRGLTKNNFYTLYDMAMLGITTHSKVPLRLATMAGFAMAFASLLVGLGYLVYKLLFWDQFSVGVAPVVIGLFLLSSVQLFFIGILGEYLGSIHTQLLNRPLVVEKERLNFPPKPLDR